MIVENINKLALRPCVLLSPLDWGLGHATRCIPIINVLLEHNTTVIIAAEGAVASLLKTEFPALVILPLGGYKVRYSRDKRFFLLKLLAQLPSIITAINHEKKWLNRVITQYKIDAVISDNRFGLHTSKRPCVYVTHQLFIETGNKWLNRIAQKIHYRFINKFNECWVPDTAGKKNLAGNLSQPEMYPSIPVKYLGAVSRCKKILTEKKYRLLIILSGPEPQRTIFEDILLKQLVNIDPTVVLLRGLAAETNKLPINKKNLVVYNHLPATALNELIQQSENIIARCGYSTIMDMSALQQKAILVPTPGQTEQEYLATYLKQKQIFYTCSQKNFSIKEAIEASHNFGFAGMQEYAQPFQKEVIINWIEALKKRQVTLQ